MIVSWGKKGLSCSLGQLKLLPREKGNFPGEQ